MKKHHKRKPRICCVSSSGGHWEQLQKLQPLLEKYDGFMVTEKTQFEAKLAKYFNTSTDYLLGLTDNSLKISNISKNEHDELLSIYSRLDKESKEDVLKYAKIREMM